MSGSSAISEAYDPELAGSRAATRIMAINNVSPAPVVEVGVQSRDVTEELEALYRDRFHDFVRVAFAIVRDEEGAREAVQEGFARALRSRRTFRREAPLEAWVWRIVINAARSARAGAFAEATPGSLDEAAAQPLANGHVSVFRAWVAALPERQRLAVFLRYWVDLDYRSIAAALDIEVGTVSATLNAAHKALRRSFEEVSP